MMESLWTPEAVRSREDIYDYIETDNPLAILSLDSLMSERAVALQEYHRIGAGREASGSF